MKSFKVMLILLAVVLTLGMFTSVYAASDTAEFPTGYFVPNESQTYNSPYYRWYNQDWGWQHGSLTVNTSASLWISAWDVDANYTYDPEVDLVYAKDNGSWVLLGSLNGLDNAWGYTTFTLGSQFYDDILAGLEVWIDIDSTHNYDNWAVTLAKSVLTTDGTTPPNPEPGRVPEPTTMLLLGLGMAGLAALKRKF